MGELPEVPAIALFTDTYDEVNGVGNTYRHLVDYCVSRGRQLDIYTYSREKTWVEEMGQVRILRFRPNLPLPIYTDLIFDPEVVQPGITREFRNRYYDIIHTATPGSMGLHALLMAKKFRIPLVGAYHTAIPEYGGIRAGRLMKTAVEEMLWKYVRWYYNHCKVVLAPSEHTKSELEKRLSTKVDIFSRGVDTDKFRPGIAERQPWMEVLYVGRLAVEKNLGLLVELSRYNRSIRLKFVGDGPFRQELETALGGRAEFMGVLRGEDLARAYASADIFVCPSETETFGNVVLEAMSSGLPVVVTDKWAPKELVRDGESGFVADSRYEFIYKVELLVSSPGLRKSMGEAARSFALSRSWEKVFDGLFGEYNKALKNTEEAEVDERKVT